ncbi:hypothetical protein [Roseomonas indoligenes]|uniref:Uncharacterized protein n=1 Tax=Roseomonas indoligenes TaxID=2820811 RepID=A0A940N0G7_9PROT|nr:hypothetical protein [Pararoseomonas indoligenes]MBP0494430.1 hypothetical protein [Pararoseomonas indoligenes]
MQARALWTLGILLVAVGVAAHAVGWEELLWFPRWVLDSLFWVPLALVDAIAAAPLTFAVIGLGVVLMVASRLIGRGRGS